MPSRDLTLSYSLYNTSSKSLSVTYNLNVPTSDFTFTYNISASTARSFGIRYDIDIGNAIGFIYDINQASKLDCRYDINVIHSLTFTWSIRFGNDLTFSYDIEQYTRQSPTASGVKDGCLTTSQGNLISVYVDDIYIMKQIRPLNVTNWEDPIAVSLGSHPSITDQNGTLWLTWEYNNYIYITTSLDGGRTFAIPITLKS